MAAADGFQWRKHGRLYRPSGQQPWMKSHAANPVALPLDDQHVRIYFSARDASNRSTISSLIAAFDGTAWRVTEPPSAPVIGPGRADDFDADGASMGSIVCNQDGVDCLYYLGWRLCRDVPWRNYIGLAVGNARRGSFRKVEANPVVGASSFEPHSVSYPCVIRVDDQFRMFYGSNPDWNCDPASIRHVIKCATSTDGKTWRLNREVLIEPNAVDHAFARPWVVRRPNGYWMWYSVRGAKYRLGLAHSVDAAQWRPKLPPGLSTSDRGWDDQAVCYASVFTFREQLWMLYNGNAYGGTGFGIAQCVAEGGAGASLSAPSRG